MVHIRKNDMLQLLSMNGCRGKRGVITKRQTAENKLRERQIEKSDRDNKSDERCLPSERPPGESAYVSDGVSCA